MFAERIIFSADSMSGQTGDSASYTCLDGHAFIKTETMEISADKIELSGNDYRFIKATGNIEGKNTESQMDFKCESMEYDRESQLATLKGNVNLTDKENDVKAESQIIEYNQNTNIVILQIQVTLTQKKNICKGAYAVYQKDLQMLDISGNAEVRQDGDTFRAQQISLNLDTQDITLSGNVKGNVTASEKNDQPKDEAEKQQQKPDESKENNQSEKDKSAKGDE